MVAYIIIGIFSLVVLMILHELGHFLVAKHFGVKVEEFGIGIPPRLAGKKIGETVYSINLLPIGAFVKIYGEDENIKNERSFSEKSVFQRALIILGGVIAFWVVAFIIFTAIMMIGVPVEIGDDVHNPDAKVMIVNVLPESPAEKAGIIQGDIIKELHYEDSWIAVGKISEMRDFFSENKGREIRMILKRGNDEVESDVVSFDEKGMIGVYLSRVATEKHSWISAPMQGALATGKMTYLISSSLWDIFTGFFSKKPLPEEVRIAGPVGIVGGVFIGALERGFVEYLMVLAVLSISLAIFNLLPIPALDGGRLLFLVIEKAKGSPLNSSMERNLIAASFILLLGILLFATIYDIQNFF